MKEKTTTFTKPIWQEKPRPSRYMSSLLAIACVAASMQIMIFQGTVLIGLFYLIWLPFAYNKGWLNIMPSKGMLIPVAIVVYSLLSSFWSVQRGITLRAALEFASVVGCALIMARTVRINDLIVGITIGMCVALVVLIILGGGIQPEEALTGGIGSKNQVGANAQVGFYCALMCLWVFRAYWKKIIFGLLPVLFCTLCLVLSRSATSDISLLAMLAITLMGYFLTTLPRNFRMPVFVMGTLFIGIFVAASLAFNLQDLVLQAAGKDTTLTGRTELWQIGYKTGMDNPVLGVGAGAFWVIGNPVAEKLWYQFGIYDRSGFHFHNLFVNLFVELGLVGVALWAWMYLSTCLKSVGSLIKNGASVESIFYVGMAFMYLVRSATEVDTTGPYGVGPLLFFTLVFRVAEQSMNMSAASSVKPASGILQSSINQEKL